jgi:hypothetical protein
MIRAFGFWLRTINLLVTLPIEVNTVSNVMVSAEKLSWDPGSSEMISSSFTQES